MVTLFNGEKRGIPRTPEEYAESVTGDIVDPSAREEAYREIIEKETGIEPRPNPLEQK